MKYVESGFGVNVERVSVRGKSFVDTITMGMTVPATSQAKAAASPKNGNFHNG